MVMVTHDMSLLEEFGKIICMDELKPVFIGTHAEFTAKR